MNEKNFCVYKHTCPDGKTYVGMTRMTLIKSRWRNGFGYETQPLFFKEIVKQGWQNISHDILYEGLSELYAKRIEEKTIRELVKIAPDKVLNHTYNPQTQQTERTPYAWLDEKISQATVDKYKSEWIFVNDDWWIPYEKLAKWSESELGYGFVDLIRYDWDGAKLSTYRYRIPYPESIITFSDLWCFLRNGVIGNWIRTPFSIIKNEVI